MITEEKLQKFTGFLDKKAFAHLSTIMPDDTPHTSPVLFSHENTLIWINTAIGWVKGNMKKNPKVTLSIQNPENPFAYVGIRRKVIERTMEGADKHIDALAKRYIDADKYLHRSPTEHRIIHKIKPVSIFGIT
ncbi:MAG: pyridoxamine 5'-phosphate oxidase family protein [Promethearchaeota archaeon]